MKTASPRAAGSDHVLWSRLRERDVGSLEALYDRYGAYVHGLALRVLGRPEEAEEIVQDVFWQLWKGSVEYDPGRGGFRTWLFAITRSRCLDRLRRRRTQPTVEWAPDVSGPVTASNPEREAYLAERQRKVMSALEDLPDGQRRALELGFFSGLSHREIADRLGEPLGTIKSRIKMGMDRLKKSLKGFEESV